MVKDCPYCGLVNPPTAEFCDCGYRFSTGRQHAPLLNEKDRAQNEELAKAARPPIPVPGGCLGLLIGVIIHGSNGLGIVIALVAFVLAITANAIAQFGTGGMIAAWGLVGILFDFGIRKFVYRIPLIEFHGGGQFVFLPIWLFGIFAFVLGATFFVAQHAIK